VDLSSLRSKVVAVPVRRRFVLFVALFHPTAGSFIGSSTLQHGGVGIIALIAAAVGMAGCLLSGIPDALSMLLFGRIIAATFMFAGVGVLLSLAFSDPKRLLALARQ